MSNPERGFNRRRFLRSGVSVALGIAGLGFAGVKLVQGLAPRGEVIAAAPETPVPTATAAVTATEAPKPTVAPTKAPTFTEVPAAATEAPKPTVIKTATGTPSPTKAVEFTPTTAATATEVATILDKSPLPIYQPFVGDLLDDKGAKIGMIVVSSIPAETPIKTATKDNVFVYYITGDKKIGYTVMAFMTNTGSIQKDGSFLAFDDWGMSRIQANLDKTGKILSGKVGIGQPGGPTKWKGNFPTLNLTGSSGKEAVLNSVRQAKMEVTNLANVSPAQVNITEIKRMVDYDKWSE